MSDICQFGAKESVDQKRSCNPTKSIRMHYMYICKLLQVRSVISIKTKFRRECKFH
jgi:hypothetical protein